MKLKLYQICMKTIVLSSKYSFKFKNIHKIYIHNIVYMMKPIDL